jgi:NCS1 family nucleobase:cation symporter-1
LTGIFVYMVGVLVQLPFISSAFYTGPLVDVLDGTDISWIVGLIVPAVLYFFAARRKAEEAPTHLILPTETVRVAEFVSK